MATRLHTQTPSRGCARRRFHAAAVVSFVWLALAATSGANSVPQETVDKWFEPVLLKHAGLRDKHGGSIIVGDDTGVLATYNFTGPEGKAWDSGEKHIIWSASKWLVATTILAMVGEGSLSLDAPLSTYLDYWTTEEDDPRSKVNLGALLRMTSGYTDGSCHDDASTMFKYDISTCAELIHGTGDIVSGLRGNEPGSPYAWNYGDMGLELARAAALSAAGLQPSEWEDLVADKVGNKVGMNSGPYWTNPSARHSHPSGWVGSSDDFVLFMQGLFDAYIEPQGPKALLPRELADGMFTMSSDFKELFGDSGEDPTFAGYGMCTWFTRPDPQLPQGMHSIGYFGFTPFIVQGVGNTTAPYWFVLARNSDDLIVGLTASTQAMSDLRQGIHGMMQEHRKMPNTTGEVSKTTGEEEEASLASSAAGGRPLAHAVVTMAAAFVVGMVLIAS